MRTFIFIIALAIGFAACTNSQTTTTTESTDTTKVIDTTLQNESNTVTPPASNGQF